MDSNAALETSVPWDTSLGNRFAHYSPDDHSATIWIAATLALTYVLGVLLIRVFIKWRMFGWDDSLIVISTILGLIQCIAVFSALKYGLGKGSKGIEDLRLVGSLAFSSRALFIASHCFAKLSLLYLLRRLFAQEQSNTRYLCNMTVGFTALAGLSSILVSTVRCPFSSFFVEHCYGQIARWSLITAFDVTSEALILILPSWMVWKVQMRVQTKLRVIAAFSFRLIVIALSSVHLHLWISYSRAQPSPFAVESTFILQQTLLAASLISATIPNLKAFIQSLSAGWGDAGFGNGYTTRAYWSGTFEMSNLNSHASPASQNFSSDFYSTDGPPEFRTHVRTSRRIAGERSSLGSGESRDRIIRKDTAWTIERS